jgi:hypothetical protein
MAGIRRHALSIFYAKTRFSLWAEFIDPFDLKYASSEGLPTIELRPVFGAIPAFSWECPIAFQF